MSYFWAYVFAPVKSIPTKGPFPILEQVKGMPGVRDVAWSEIVRIIGRKRSIPPAIIDKL